VKAEDTITTNGSDTSNGDKNGSLAEEITHKTSNGVSKNENENSSPESNDNEAETETTKKLQNSQLNNESSLNEIEEIHKDCTKLKQQYDNESSHHNQVITLEQTEVLKNVTVNKDDGGNDDVVEQGVSIETQSTKKHGGREANVVVNDDADNNVMINEENKDDGQALRKLQQVVIEKDLLYSSHHLNTLKKKRVGKITFASK